MRYDDSAHGVVRNPSLKF